MRFEACLYYFKMAPVDRHRWCRVDVSASPRLQLRRGDESAKHGEGIFAYGFDGRSKVENTGLGVSIDVVRVCLRVFV